MTIVGGAAAVAAAGLNPVPATSLDHKRYGGFSFSSFFVLQFFMSSFLLNWIGVARFSFPCVCFLFFDLPF